MSGGTNGSRPASRTPLPPGRRRLPLVLGLLVLSPICAEYLLGYDNSVGDTRRLLGGLVILGPLYGAPALLIREATRRLVRDGRAGWPTLLLFGAALGVVEAGVVDQSIFNDSYRDIEGWERDFRATYVPPLGLGFAHALGFVAGHMIWSFGAPIAVVESFAGPLARRPWLGRIGISTLAVLYGLAMIAIFADHVEKEQFTASPAHLSGGVVVAAALVALGVVLAVRPPVGAARGALAPRPWKVAACTAFGVGALVFAPQSWAGVAVSVLGLAGLATLLVRWSRRRGWDQRHRLAAASAPLLMYAVLAFAVEPLGDVDQVRKFAHNTVFGTGLVMILAWAHRRVRLSHEVTVSTAPIPDDRLPK